MGFPWRELGSSCNSQAHSYNTVTGTCSMASLMAPFGILPFFTSSSRVGFPQWDAGSQTGWIMQIQSNLCPGASSMSCRFQCSHWTAPDYRNNYTLTTTTGPEAPMLQPSQVFSYSWSQQSSHWLYQKVGVPRSRAWWNHRFTLPGFSTNRAWSAFHNTQSHAAHRYRPGKPGISISQATLATPEHCNLRSNVIFIINILTLGILVQVPSSVARLGPPPGPCLPGPVLPPHGAFQPQPLSTQTFGLLGISLSSSPCTSPPRCRTESLSALNLPVP